MVVEEAFPDSAAVAEFPEAVEPPPVAAIAAEAAVKTAAAAEVAETAAAGGIAVIAAVVAVKPRPTTPHSKFCCRPTPA